MLSKFSFDDFFSEYNLKTIDNKKLFLVALLSFKNFNTTQIHKLSFLTFAEKNTILPFEFIKMPYGPFSPELKELLNDFSKEGLVNTDKESHSDWKENIWSLSEKGKALVSSNTTAIEDIKRKIIGTLEEYDEVKAKALERYCYNNYFLNSNKEKTKEWEIKIKTNIDNLQTILKNRARDLERIEDIDESSRSAVLSCFDYIDSLLNFLDSNSQIDQVIKGVLIKKCESYINIWGEILCLVNDKGNELKVRALLKDSKELFNFINLCSEKYGVFESVF